MIKLDNLKDQHGQNNTDEFFKQMVEDNAKLVEELNNYNPEDNI